MCYMGHEPYKEKETLYELYHGEGMTQKEIGDKFGCSGVTVGNWMEKHGIPTTRAYKHIDFIRQLYEKEKMTQKEIGERLGVPASNISKVMVDSDIETRQRGDLSHPSIYFSQDGYLTCRHRLGGHDRERVAFRIHRLVAVAEYGFDAVAGQEIHHKNNHKADNRRENLEPINASEHVELHHKQDDIIY